MIYEKYIRVLHIDLTAKKVRIEHREDLYGYLGGVGVASKLLEENMHPELDPLDEKQPVIFAIGAASTIFPVITKTVATFISPLTGEYGESYAGGRMAMSLFYAGYDAVVITGKSDKPVYISIKKNNVEFKDARAMWGLDPNEVERILREREKGHGKRSIVSIGPAGENLSSFACVCVDIFRHFGRLGLGACFGSKNLKAVLTIGDKDIPIKDFKNYFSVYQEIYKECSETTAMTKYHDLGTPVNIEPLNAAGALPTRNLQQTSFENSEDISGETFADKNLVRKMSCTGCPVGCIHIGQLRRQFDKGHEYESLTVAYDYELIFSLGTFLGVKTSEEVLNLIDHVEKTGFDAMSMGVVLGWATEALTKGIITEEQTMLPLAFGDSENYAKAIEYTAKGANEFYRDLGKGSAYVSAKYGGSDFALEISKNEMAGYHTGYGALVGAAVGTRHSHLCNGGYSIDQSGDSEFDGDKLVDKLYKEEVERCMLNSLIICLFARKVYNREKVLKVLNSIGRETTDDELTAIAERIYRTKLRIKKALGYNQKDIKFPKRFFETVSMNGELKPEIAQELINKFISKNEELMNREV
ncbi:putative oxidoreductase [Sebaldella termitidis]|uniref:Aldehyde ferredoxin oxidoreductase n=1 Tax=Sebaldella termitidis (strain ATCC 33386 / NCTC 11300) TaxID=526218 RepID=D1AFU5_SEBTE|nr:aldehyde ferredoxin oxidoreductase N-terminal domain-containing protein [Sebaldella termitidis]ACZ07980.1 Aldehyde ferredoxin oxidoreductase [Sebaldella termitidis ATCC 33386]SUI23281.1 putative oxidoreductase [Sebaldella termitidis]